MKHFALIIGLLFLVTSCASSGPMQSKHGLAKTKAFDPIFIESTNNRVKEVSYKSPTVMFREEMPAFALITDTLVITDSGVFLVEWNTEHLNFNHKLDLSFAEIKDVNAVVEEHSILPDSQQLKVTTTYGEHYYFMITDGSVEVARKLIETRLDK